MTRPIDLRYVRVRSTEVRLRLTGEGRPAAGGSVGRTDLQGIPQVTEATPIATVSNHTHVSLENQTVRIQSRQWLLLH